MKVLLDTHAFLWWVTDSPQLSKIAREVIGNAENTIFVSAASAWEISTKVRLGKLTGVPGIVERFAELMAADGFLPLPITHLQALRGGSFDVPHRDPFDRLLAAQSELEAMPLLTRDPAFTLFAIKTLW